MNGGPYEDDNRDADSVADAEHDDDDHDDHDHDNHDLVLQRTADALALEQRARAQRELATALRKNGINRTGLISRLSRIAAKGEKVETTIEDGVVKSVKITNDPKVQLEAIDRLEKLLDRLEGMGVRRERHFSEYEYE